MRQLSRDRFLHRIRTERNGRGRSRDLGLLSITNLARVMPIKTVSRDLADMTRSRIDRMPEAGVGYVDLDLMLRRATMQAIRRPLEA